MELRYLAFSHRGEALAGRLAQALGGEAARCGRPLSLAAWTEENFARGRGLIFVGAAGIAVRAIAPWIRSKTTDPAVVVVDEGGRFAVPILSGHLGGANDLARAIAGVCGGTAVVTTATDVNGLFAVDEWARRQNGQVVEPERIRNVSAAVLSGGTVRVFSPWPIGGERPPGVAVAEDGDDCEVRLDVRSSGGGCLHIAPRILTLGVGCRRGTGREALERAFAALVERSGVWPEAVAGAASIDLKREEQGLLDFCAAHGWPCRFYSAARLEAAEGAFTPSAFVKDVTGVDNVCERSAVLASGGTLYWKKSAGEGVTMALAAAPYAPDWRWKADGE